MMTYIGQEFHHLRHVDEPATYSGMNFENCEFFGCVVMQTDDPAYPIRITDTTVTGGRLINNNAMGVKFEDVTISDCPTVGAPMNFSGCVFHRVVMRGRLGSWIFNDMHKKIAEPIRRQFKDAEREFYASAEFALDISDARFESVALFQLPGDLIRRDPETQFLIRKKDLIDADLSSVSRSVRRELDRVMRNPYDSTVLVAGLEDEDFVDLLASYRQLVELGIAE